MKTTLLSGCALFAAYAAGVLIHAGAFEAGVALACIAGVAEFLALNAARVGHFRTMLRDLRRIEALLDDNRASLDARPSSQKVEFDHD
jgi:hypothetical protein